MSHVYMQARGLINTLINGILYDFFLKFIWALIKKYSISTLPL